VAAGHRSSEVTTTNPRKLQLARLLDLAGVNGLLLRLQAVVWRPHVRGVNYHDVPATRAADFEAQLRFYAERFVDVGLDDLEALRDGRWPHERPGLIISFDDGLRTHAEVAAPLLETYGFTGWFFIPVGLLDTPPERQSAFARKNKISLRGMRDGRRVAMTWDDARRLDARHVVGCHTMNHVRLSDSLTDEDLDREIVQAKRRIEEELGHDVPVFAWVGGEEWSYSAGAARAIRDAGFTVGFMTNNAVIRPHADLLQLQRTNIESDYPPPLMRFQLSGFMDLLFAAKRRRVNRLTSGPARVEQRRMTG
jgi:peptidoglycan/xylan/chitin deacetylase (PgdA/CDA1 family)